MPLPTFLICGPPKTGSTALYRYMKQHPDIFMCPVKEPLFFNEPHGRKLDDYARLFDDHGTEHAIGEASTRYMQGGRSTARRIQDAIPDVRLIFLLRDPVRRALSNYWYGMLVGSIPPTATISSLLDEEGTQHFVFWPGFYARHLNTYETVFDSDQMLILLTDDLKTDTETTVQRAFDFVGVSSSFEPRTERRHNVTMYPRDLDTYRLVYRWMGGIERWMLNTPLLRPIRRRLFFSSRKGRPSVSDEEKAVLRDLYADSNAALRKKIRRPLPEWS